MGMFDKAIELKEKTRLMTLRVSHNYGSVALRYVGGGEISRECNIRLGISNRYLKYGAYVMHKIPIENLIQVSFENNQQITQRLTATRVLLTGGLGIFFPKKKLNNMKYLLIEYTYNDISTCMILSGKNTTKAYTLINKAIHDHKELIELSEKYNVAADIEGDDQDDMIELDTNIEDANDDYEDEKSSSLDPYEELKKLKELLDLGIISHEEFDQKKKELLNL